MRGWAIFDGVNASGIFESNGPAVKTKSSSNSLLQQMSQHAESTSARGGRAPRPPRQNHGGDRSAAGGEVTFENMRTHFPNLQISEFEQAKQKHGNDAEGIVQALSAEFDGWLSVKTDKKKDVESEKSKTAMVDPRRDRSAPAAGGQPRPEGISRGAPNNGAGRGVPRAPRPADAPPRESRPPRADAPPRPREAERPVTAPDARPAARTPRQPTESSPKAAAAAAAAAPVAVKVSSAIVNKWGSGPTLAQQEKDKVAAAERALVEQAQAAEAERKAQELRERLQLQQAQALAKQQQQQREAPVASSPKQSSVPAAVAAPKAAAPAPVPAAAAPAPRLPTGGFKMSFQNPAALNPSTELQFGDMSSAENAQPNAFQPQEQASGYTATFATAEAQAQGNGDAASLNGTFMHGHTGGPRYQQTKPATQQHMPHHQMGPYGFWNPQMMYAMGNASMYGHMGMPMGMPFAYPQGYGPQQGMYGQQPHNSSYNRHGKNQSHNAQSTHGGAQHQGVAPSHHYQQQQQPAYPPSFPAADGQEGSLDATQQQQQQQHKDVQQPYYQAYGQQFGKAAGKVPNAGMGGHQDFPAYPAQQAYWSGSAQQFAPQQHQQQQQQQHASTAAAQQSWPGHTA